MTITITEREQQIILAALNFTASAFTDKAAELDALHDKLDQPQPTATDKDFFVWLARHG